MANDPKPRRDVQSLRRVLLTALRPPWRVRSLTWRILALNVLALATLVVGLLYLDRYRDSLVQTQIDALMVQAEIVAAAIGEAAVRTQSNRPADLLNYILGKDFSIAAFKGVHISLCVENGVPVAREQVDLAGTRAEEDAG